MVQGGTREEAIRVRGAWGIRAMMNGRFSLGVKSEKWTKDTRILLLVNEVGQWEEKISHDGELLQDLQCLASDFAHSWQVPFLTWFGYRQRTHQEQSLDTSAPFTRLVPEKRAAARTEPCTCRGVKTSSLLENHRTPWSVIPTTENKRSSCLVF